MQVQARLEEIHALGADVVVVTFVSPSRLGQYLRIKKWPFRVFADPEMNAYRAFGLGRAGWLRLFHPRVILTYLELIIRGRRPQMAQEDVHQLGGDFVMDREGRVIYEYRSHDPADRPRVSDLIEVVRRAVALKSGSEI